MAEPGLVHAIDFGTSNSEIIVCQRDGRQAAIRDPLAAGSGSPSIPTSVCVLPDGSVAVGIAAERAKAGDPAAYRGEFKRDFGTTDPTLLGDRWMTPDQLAVEVLAFLREQAQAVTPGEPERVVVTVPVSWERARHELMRSCVRRAGYPDAAIDLIAEPVAALAYAFGEHHSSADPLTFLVYDLGGGTFDCALARGAAGQPEALGKPAGIDGVGGAAFDRLLLGLVTERNATATGGAADDVAALGRRLRLTETCEKIKRRLSEVTEHDEFLTELLPPAWFSISRAEFEVLIRSRVEATISACSRLIDSAGITWAEVDRVVPVGGSSAIPLVKARLAELSGRPVLDIDQPDQAVVRGAALLGRLDDRPRNLTVNGRPRVSQRADLGYGEIIALAFDRPPDEWYVTITVTYQHAVGVRPSGSLAGGQRVRVQDGTVFNVIVTDKS